MSPPAVHFLRTCRFCSHARPAYDFIGDACSSCYEGHRKALDYLAGHPPEGCTRCKRDFDTLAHEQPGTHVKMYLHRMDGLYALLCKTCSDWYERKRLDLYAATPYGRAKKLAGAK